MFRKKSKGNILSQMVGQIAQVATDVRQRLQQSSGLQAIEGLALEGAKFSVDQTAQAELEDIETGVSVSLESMITDLGLGKQYTTAQKEAAQYAALLFQTKAPLQADRSDLRGMALEAGTVVIPDNSGLHTARNKLALEAYDNTDNRNVVARSVAYNMQAARQDEFGEAFFPTITLSPEQMGFSISVRLIQVLDDIRRDVNGTPTREFGRRNIIQALVDPTILKNDMTRLVPVFHDGSKDKFVDPAVVAPHDTDVEGETVTTAPLAIGKTVSLLNVSQTEALLKTGLLDTTDALDSALALRNLYMQVGADVVKLANLQLMPSATFVPAQQGYDRLMNLQFISNALPLNAGTVRVDGAALVDLKPIVDNNWSIKLSVSVFGSCNLQLSDTELNASRLSVYEIRDADGNVVPLDTGAGKAIADLIAAGQIVGYDIEARRINSNRRERGQLLDQNYLNMVYALPTLSPITIPRPINSNDQNDTSDLAALITATHVRTTNAAVAALLEAEDVLRSHVTKNGTLLNQDTEVLGAGRLLVSPFYEYKAIDLRTVVTSVKSSERSQDIQDALITILRDQVYRGYRDSNYKSAADAMNGGIGKVPTVIIGTDPVIARWLMVTGDFRTLGGEFEVKLVVSQNINMRGKIRWSFGQFGEGFEGVQNPLHFGNMAWRPEITLVLPLHRNGANSKELTVQPSFKHIVNLPIMGSIDLSGISDLVDSQVPYPFKQV